MWAVKDSYLLFMNVKPKLLIAKVEITQFPEFNEVTLWWLNSLFNIHSGLYLNIALCIFIVFAEVVDVDSTFIWHWRPRPRVDQFLLNFFLNLFIRTTYVPPAAVVTRYPLRKTPLFATKGIPKVILAYNYGLQSILGIKRIFLRSLAKTSLEKGILLSNIMCTCFV